MDKVLRTLEDLNSMQTMLFYDKYVKNYTSEQFAF